MDYAEHSLFELSIFEQSKDFKDEKISSCCIRRNIDVKCIKL